MSTYNSRVSGQRTPPRIFTLILLAGLSALGMNLHLPSLAGMSEYYAVDYRVMQLSVALYLAGNAVVQIFVGPISDQIGRRPVILVSIVLFLLATLGCIYAPTAEAFLLFRVAQTAVAATMVLSRAAVRDMYDTNQAASMIGYVTMGMAIVPMIGPAIGGFLDQWMGWQANFWLLFLVGAATLAITFTDFGETAHKSGKTLMAQFREYPELLRSPRFWGYSLASGLASGAFFAYLGGAPFVGTEVYGLSTAELGVYFSTPAVGYFAGNFISGRFSTRIGVNRMVLWGCIINGGGVLVSLLIAMAGADSVFTFFGLMCFIGLGNGMAIPNATAGAISVRPHLAGTASGLSGAIMIGAGAALSAFAGMLLVPGSTAVPLLAIMFGTAMCGLAAILLVVRRERQIGA
ncbi:MULTISPECIES: multidrug effflux MFS transporter [unclassified Leisingera]|uniref:multidrug effflux MFS transporter n=1 Tax=unclassified Leisingera TaxID=2614906 RepID=UPI0010115DB0|nr:MULTISPECIES: multidrug effflux MFS transporter [unclassified Leisingera]MBQ4824219.1 multidrug effflux MFS transporter [Leisingera sp. HS039]MCF6430497.1 multidrug effflux MFS transporter [Leisingera sp. MMG026]QAX29175.1 Bcr/CflA family efflux MFS transporter [Leisingera sp. NJS204]QBR36828.1 Bcr/CflA family efflux MFS transporter [Leisingera sp. NJS201]